jgi:hypothetical protein
MSKTEVNKYTINFTREDRIMNLRRVFIDMYIKKHLKDNPQVKKSLEDKFQQLVEEFIDNPVAS